MDDAFSRTKDLFRRACERPEAERTRFLEQHCDDPELRERVADLLSAGALDDGFLEPPGIAASPETSPENSMDPGSAGREGTRIGAFRIVRHSASGGMGEVFEAEQDDPRRRVALKTMRLGFEREGDRRRFRREIEVLANLKHPGIAQIHASGVHVDDTAGVRREVPWFAMEFVEGARTVLAFAEEERLVQRERIELFGAFCDAVDHGHRMGIVHRDLKPDNLLVDADGRPKVIDFGVARVVDTELDLTTFETRADLVLGTLATMSPEQVGGAREDLDARSDVYALGVVLFELLTGARPLELSGKSLPEAARAIREDPPLRLRRLVPEASRDLETVVSKALEKEPARRYASAAALADDLRRFLASEPIEARPASTAYRARLFLRRNRALSTAGGVTLLVVLAAVLVSRGFEARAAESDSARQGVVDVLLERDFELTSTVADRLLHVAGGMELTLELVGAAVIDLEAMLAASDNDPWIREQVARAYLRLGDVHGNPYFPNLGDRDEAESYYRRADDLVADLVDDSLEAKRVAGQCRRKAGAMAFSLLDYDTALREYELAHTLFGEILQEAPNDWLAKKDVAYSHETLSVVHGRARRQDEQAAHAQLSIELFLELRESKPDLQEEWDAFLAGGYTNLAAIEVTKGNYSEAIEEYGRAESILERLLEASPSSLMYRGQLAWARMWRGSCELYRERPDAAESAFLAALEQYELLRAQEPDNVQHGPRIANLYQQLASVARNRAGAPDATDEERADDTETARVWLQKTLDMLLDLEAKGTLPIQLKDGAARVRTELAELDPSADIE